MADLTSSSWNQEDNLNISPPPNGLPTGSKPSELAPTIRAIMGAEKRFFDHINAMVVSTGTATAFALTYDVALSAYTKGEVFAFFAHVDNTGALTLNISGNGARAVVRNDGAALTAGQIKSGQAVAVVYDGTSFRVLSPLFNNPTFTGTLTVPTISASGTITASSFVGNGSALTGIDAITVGGVSGASIVQTSRTVTAGNGLTGGGALSADRTITLAPPGTITNTTTNAVFASSHTHELTLTAANIITILGFTPPDRTNLVTAGNGLSGGGSIAADRTITMGTPGSITNASTNAVTTSSHTHALGFTAAEVYTGSSVGGTTYPLGHLVLMQGGSYNRNASVPPAIWNNVDSSYIQETSGSAGASLAGTWRSRGKVSDYTLCQRTA